MGVFATTWEAFRALVRRGTPLFALELRVHSRQWRTYAFRAIYVGLLLVYVALLWTGAVSQAKAGGGSAWSQSVMADVGQRVTRDVLVFQFLAGQVAAIALMCGAFSEEFARGRMPTLLTTPLSNTQVVAGKYLSRLVQLLVLMLATLPVLAVVRLFGGVPWLYLLGGTFLSLAAAMFTAAMTLWNALQFPKPHAAALRTMPWAFGMCVLVGLACLMEPMTVASALRLLFVSAATLGAAFFVVGHLCRLEFTNAVRKAVGDWRLPPQDSPYRKYDFVYLPPVPGEVSRAPSRYETIGDVRNALGHVDHVRDHPLYWKATRRLNNAMGSKQVLLIVGLVLIYVYAGAFSSVGTTSMPFHLVAFCVMAALIFLWCGFQAACSISMDKESGFWPLVLATPLDEWTIFHQRMRVIFQRSWMILAAAGVHVLTYTVAGVLHPVSLLQLPILLAWVTLFVVAAGMYFSAHCRTTTNALLATFTTLAALWLGLPLLSVLLGNMVPIGGWLHGASLWLAGAGPATHISACLSGSVETYGEFAPMTWRDGSGNTLMSAGQFLLMTTFWTVVYAGAGLWLIRTTVRSFRWRVYE